jgi:hypothetical protein
MPAVSGWECQGEGWYFLFILNSTISTEIYPEPTEYQQLEAVRAQN